MNIFKKKNKPSKYLLRIFGNMGKSQYSQVEKMKISECLISTAKELLSTNSLKYDISGSGYKISKGSQLLGERAFRNKIAKNGYENMWGMTVLSTELGYDSEFLLITRQGISNRFEGNFMWSLNSDSEQQLATEIINRVAKVCRIEYAYSYPTTDLLTLGEWNEKKKFMGSTVYKPKSEKLWDSHISDITQGKIKKLYPINFFNLEQIKLMTNLKPTKQKLDYNGAEIWELSDSEINRGNKLLTNIILK